MLSGAQSIAEAAARTGRAAVSPGSSLGLEGGLAGGFGQLLDNVEQTSAEANQAVSAMVDKTGDVHDAMIALQRAEMAFEFTVQIRNKFVQAYQDIMRMPI